MSSYLYTWNPKKWNWSDLQYAIYQVNNDEFYEMSWSCGNTKRISIGDMFFFMKLGVEPKGIIGCGYISSKPYELKHWDETKASEGAVAFYTDLLFKSLSETPILSLDYLKDGFSGHKWTPQVSGLSIAENISIELLASIQNSACHRFEDSSKEEIKLYSEGKVRTVTSKAYDRSSKARQVCLEYYGYDCNVCGFNFAEVYGDLGADYIEVHHLKQIADIAEEYKVDPIVDLRPVCANCHRMLHKKRPSLSIEELQIHNNVLRKKLRSF